MDLQDHEALAGHVAHVMGPSSGAAKALAELQKRRAEGEENVGIWLEARQWVVGPNPNTGG